VHICSVNNFPTAAGLASSAAGYACLVAALAQLFNVADTELSAIARVGSGSACRSMYGGFVRWTMGELADGSDSVASQVAPASHWPEMEVLILVVNASKKATSSTAGMQHTVNTSALIDHRARVVVPQRMREIEAAIQAKDFETFGRLTIQDSNQFHAVCLDTYPPIFYLNDVSKYVVTLLSRFNAHAGEVKAAYTFDAGPNCVIYARKADVPALLALVRHYLPATAAPADGEPFFRGLSSVDAIPAVPADVEAALKMEPQPDSIKYVIHTKIGEGPQVLGPEASLLDAAGLPK
jgi:diphosphomevalonate decarboxylase